jgi:hypothetical protein
MRGSQLPGLLRRWDCQKLHGCLKSRTFVLFDDLGTLSSMKPESSKHFMIGPVKFVLMRKVWAFLRVKTDEPFTPSGLVTP